MQIVILTDKPVATVCAITAERLNPSDNTVITFAEQGPIQVQTEMSSFFAETQDKPFRSIVLASDGTSQLPVRHFRNAGNCDSRRNGRVSKQ
jgi:hypothetical protein